MSTTLPIYRWLVPASAAADAHADHEKLVAARRDPRLSAVAWRDLLGLARWEVVDELCLSLPWLAASLALAQLALWPAAMLCSFMFYLAALRQIHNGTHYALGIGKGATGWFLFAMSIALLGSNHAVQYNHLRHHRHCLGPEDVEGVNARLSAWKVLLCGPVYPLMQHWWALSTASLRALARSRSRSTATATLTRNSAPRRPLSWSMPAARFRPMATILIASSKPASGSASTISISLTALISSRASGRSTRRRAGAGSMFFPASAPARR